MPGMTGAELTRLMHSGCSDSFIIGYSAQMMRHELLEEDADIFLENRSNFKSGHYCAVGPERISGGYCNIEKAIESLLCSE